MVASISNAVAAYANAGKIAGPGLAARDGGSFADLLKQAGGDAMGALKQGEAQSLQAVTGKADITAVTAAVNNAELALHAVVALRDKVIAAYQDISKMPI